MTDNSKVIAIIDSSSDPKQLRRFIENARRMKAPDVRDAAFRRLVEILPEEEPGSVEHDFWRSIHALEQVLLEERGKTVRLSRTRQKIARVGVMQTLRDFAAKKSPTQGFEMLLERGMPELTGEARPSSCRPSCASTTSWPANAPPRASTMCGISSASPNWS